MLAAVCLRRYRRRKALVVAIVVLAGGVVLAHGATAADHMGDAAMICLAVTNAATLGVLALAAPAAFDKLPRARIVSSIWPRERRGAPRPGLPPWPRGSPVALRVLRL